MAMGDIAFNLLIFFVILARATDDSHLKWDPAATTNVQRAGASKVSVLIDVDNKVYLNGQPIGAQARKLTDNDVLQLAGVKMGFFAN